MAPSKAQPPQAKTKAASGHNAKKPTTPAASAKSATSAAKATRPVILPAIPLPMMQRQPAKPSKAPTNQKKHTTAVNNSSNGFPAVSLDAALIDQVSPDSAKAAREPKGQHLQSAKPSENEVNGSDVEKPDNTITQSNAMPTIPATTATTNAVNASSGHIRVPLNGTNGIGPPSQPTTTAASQSSSAPFNAEVESNTADSTSISAVDIKLGAQDARSFTSQAESVVSPSRAVQQPHIFNPRTHPPYQQEPADRRPEPLTFHPGANMHHPHPHTSNGGGNIMFGGLPESHTPSPAPPGAFIPPPMPVNGDNSNFARANGHQHVQSNGHGFPAPAPAPINTQFRPDLARAPVSSIDTYGPLSAHVPQGPFEVFPPGANRYGPPTPHSFHGSHASGEPNGMDSGPMPFPPNNMHYASHGPHEHPTGHHHQHIPHHQHPPHGPFPPFLPAQMFPRRHPSIAEGELIESVLYFRNQFANRELADCVLELVYANGRHHPTKITGHKLILAQSPALKHYIMSAQTVDSSGSHTITIESNDAYLRSDAWWAAVQRLYMHPLMNIPPIVGNGTNGVDFAGDKIDRFEYCLGYAAAGHLLEMQDVLIRGLQVTADLLNWATIEHALGFVLEGTTQRHTDYGVEQDGTSMSFVELEYGYGPETKILMDAIMNFLINAFPSNFELDPAVSDPSKYARIPAIPSPAAIASPRASLPPTIARGSNPRNASKPARLGSIKFGDLPAAYPEDGPAPQRESAKCSPVLSRILLNLPFDELRAVLTSESNGISGWNTAQDRYHVVADVIAAREARRLRAVDAIRARAIPNALEIQMRLSAQRRHAIVETWDVLNWQEEVIQPRGGELPRLGRKWVPQFSAPPERELQRQVPAPAYDSPKSMV